MNQNAKKLVEALRSGEFSQVGRYLHTPDGYCCLGVATELYLREHGGEWEPHQSVGETIHWYEFDDLDAVLSPKVQDWLGFRTSRGDFSTNSLASLNDSGKTFKEIADVIESEPFGLFKEEAL